MYTEFYELHRYPFDSTLSSSALFRWPSFREAEARLHYVIRKRGLTYLVGPVGIGKTTVLRAVRDSLDPEAYRLCYVPSPALPTRALFRHLTAAFGQEVPNAFGDVLKALHDHLLALHHQGLTPVACLDDAQAASLELLESLRTLTNFEMDSHRVLAVLFVGQETFASRLKLAAHHPLAQRMVQPYQISPLRVEETAAYVTHHLEQAGASDPLFEDDALALIHQASKGVPRQINRLCEMALMGGASEQQKSLSLQMIQKVLDDIGTL